MAEIWKGEASEPAELANEVASALAHVLQLPGVEPIELVTVTMSSANRDLIVSALRNLAIPNWVETGAYPPASN